MARTTVAYECAAEAPPGLAHWEGGPLNRRRAGHLRPVGGTATLSLANHEEGATHP